MNVQEVINISKQRKNRLKEVTEKIIDNIHKKIKYYAKNRLESCTYLIPPLIDDTPIYNRTGLARDIYKRLNEEGYIVSAYETGQIDIFWNEKLVQQKLDNDRYILTQQERRLNKYNKTAKVLNERFSFLSNPQKVRQEPTLEEKIDQHLEKILKDKDRHQKEFAKRVGNFNKL